VGLTGDPQLQWLVIYCAHSSKKKLKQQERENKENENEREKEEAKLGSRKEKT
jgi:hypothetical protein